MESRKTIAGALWSSHSPRVSSLGLMAADFEVRDIEEKEVVVIVAQDGISGLEDEVGEKLVAQASELLNFRWHNAKLVDAIVSSKEFAAGDYRASIEAGFKSVDRKVWEKVKQLDPSLLEWTEPLVWQAVYNSMVVIVTRDEVFIAGAGSFKVSVVSESDVKPISGTENRLVTRAKVNLSGGLEEFEGIPDLNTHLKNIGVPEAKAVTMACTLIKYALAKGDECIVVERQSGRHQLGSIDWLEHGKNWGAALAALCSLDLGPERYYHGMVLSLDGFRRSSASCSSQQMPAQVGALSPTSRRRALPAEVGDSPTRCPCPLFVPPYVAAQS